MKKKNSRNPLRRVRPGCFPALTMAGTINQIKLKQMKKFEIAFDVKGQYSRRIMKIKAGSLVEAMKIAAEAMQADNSLEDYKIEEL